MSDDAGNKIYIFKLGDNPCDICKSMEGEYEVAPSVPIHQNCDCTVEEKKDVGDGWICNFEYRDLECYDEEYTESSPPISFENPEDEDTDATLIYEPETFEEYWDEGVEEAADWPPTPGTTSKTITIPAKSIIYVTLEIQIVSRICKATKYKICVKGDPIAGVHQKETLVGQVGGGATASVGIKSVSISSELIINDEEPDWYFDTEEEIPV